MRDSYENMFDDMSFIEGLFVVIGTILFQVGMPLIGLIVSIVMLLNVKP